MITEVLRYNKRPISIVLSTYFRTAVFNFVINPSSRGANDYNRFNLPNGISKFLNLSDSTIWSTKIPNGFVNFLLLETDQIHPLPLLRPPKMYIYIVRSILINKVIKCLHTKSNRCLRSNSIHDVTQ